MDGELVFERSGERRREQRIVRYSENALFDKESRRRKFQTADNGDRQIQVVTIGHIVNFYSRRLRPVKVTSSPLPSHHPFILFFSEAQTNENVVGHCPNSSTSLSFFPVCASWRDV